MSHPLRSPAEGIYRRLTVRMYGDQRFMRLSPLLPSGQALWMYLLTGPHTGPIPGVFVAGRAALAEALGWDAQAFQKAFAEVLSEGLAEFDEKTRMCFIPNAIHHNTPPNPNVVKSWRAPWLQLPECDLRGRIFDHLQSALSEVSDAFGKAFEETCGKPFENASPKASPKHMAKQEQEAGDRKQEKKTSAKRRPIASPAGSLFDEFWSHYPKKAAKKAAQKAFDKVNPDRAKLDAMIVAIKAQKTSEGWKKDKGQFIPNGATWLNGERWTDELNVDLIAAPANADYERNQAMLAAEAERGRTLKVDPDLIRAAKATSEAARLRRLGAATGPAPIASLFPKLDEAA